ncbi:MAG: hypothetical protein ACRC33_06600 [Gemmataceae bacterium]
MFLVEVMTTAGRLSEAFPTYEAASARVDAIPDAELLGMPLIFQDLPDGSQRIVRYDGKPLQAHRPTLAADPGDALPMATEDVPLGELRPVYMTPQDEAPDTVDPLGRVRRRDPE